MSAAHATYCGILICLVITSCAPLPVPADEMNEAEQNLAAIRALLSTRVTRSIDHEAVAARPAPGHEQEELPSSTVWYGIREQALGFGMSMPRSGWSPVGGQVRGKPDPFQVVIPWRPEASRPLRVEQSFRPVPPYSYSPPLGSLYPGAPRCTPDYAGGQWCGR